MSKKFVPEPTVMPVDRSNWAKQLGLNNFINAFYQFNDLQLFNDCRKVLIVGLGQGLERIVLKWRGYEITTLDIDETFQPDYVGSVHDLHMFKDGQFDAVIASHVLEHLAVPYLDSALGEIARVGRNAIIYLPVHGKHLQWRFMTGSRIIDLSLIIDLFNYFKKTNGLKPCYMENQHFWEIGIRGFRVKDMVKRFSNFFDIIRVYRNRDWLPSQNFVLVSKFNHRNRCDGT